MTCLNRQVEPAKAILRADPAVRHQTIRTFGASGAWWATGIGDSA